MKKCDLVFRRLILIFNAGILLFACDMTMQSVTKTEVYLDSGRLNQEYPFIYYPAWSPNGDYISYTSHEIITEVISVSTINGESEKAWRINRNPIRELIISSTGKKVLCRFRINSSQPWIFEEDGDSVPFPSNYIDLESACWSHDDKYVAFSEYTNNQQIYLYSTENRQIFQVFTEKENTGIYMLSCCWSPDDQNIAVSSRNMGNFCIYVIDPFGGNMAKHEIFSPDSTALIRGLDWSPDGRNIAYVKYSLSSYRYQLCVVPASGGHETVIFYSDSERITGSPAWSPDGTKLAFYLGDELCILDVGTQDYFAIANIRQYTKPVWTAGGNALLTVNQFHKYQIHISSFTDSFYHTIPFENTDFPLMQTCWLRNKNGIVFSYFDTFWEYSLDEGKTRQLSPPLVKGVKSFQLCPVDDHILLFDSEGDIYQLYLDDLKIVNLSQNINDYLHDPAWSPDGKQFVCCLRNGMIIGKIKDNQMDILKTIDGEWFERPAWSPDYELLGSHIAAISSRGGIEMFSLQEPDAGWGLLNNWNYPAWHPKEPKLAGVFDDSHLEWILVFKKISH
ncbi:PD40 domain-containing protein [candidate division KSB1 bacterium]|nr:PD40 domain-containing protein [candidate division KSB1 bacterium]